MSTIAEMQSKIPGALTVSEVEAYGDAGIIRTIAALSEQKVGGEDGDLKPCLSFTEDAKLLVVNKTRAQQLADLFGAATDPTGEKVKLVARSVKVGNRPMVIICVDEAT